MLGNKISSSPIRADRHQTAFAHHRHQRDRSTGRGQQTTQAARRGQVVARVNDHDVGGSCLEQRRHVSRRRPHRVGEQRQRWQDPSACGSAVSNSRSKTPPAPWGGLVWERPLPD
ncbi:hypothetical protein I553_5233 [Mycobacterium xenopi 4042]|uniref:Uncharacterized protein n=1 Tax=Mycobacterium xenopi 4042 TaxID=1299334 RepID=X7ZXA4_MYCXE|nr:hypothetical protein I553_5233 [Mycobacterium xenopi 4042]